MEVEVKMVGKRNNTQTQKLMNNNGTQLWANYEMQLLYNENLSDEDIARLTGRSLSAVRNKRQRESGEYKNEVKKRKIEGEIRILNLAKELNIKLNYCG
jgi:hypothetical protein